MKQLAYLAVFLLLLSSVLAANISISVGQCYEYSTDAVDDGYVDDLVIEETCNDLGSVDWTGSVLNLTALGPITSGISIIEGSIIVDTFVRPDLDYKARLTFKSLPYAITPIVLKDGVECVASCDNVTYSAALGELAVDVTGFSNYTLTNRQDMTVYTDKTAYLKDKIYQTIDFGATNATYKCVVMIFDSEDHNLIQSNPVRQKRDKDVLSISTDLNLEDNSPEYLGYFKTENGLANVYYEKDLLIGYETFVYVAKCHSDAGEEMIFEELITPQYWEAFKAAPAKWVWWNQNASVATWMVIFIIMAVMILWMVLKTMWRM
jgi:hypothetical protein